MSKNISVFGLYANQPNVEAAVDALRNAGFRNTDISVLFPENQGTKDFAIRKETKAPESAATGGATLGVVGGALGWLAGIGALAIPGIGPFIAAGPIMAMLAGVGAGAALGGIAGALVGLGIPEYEAKRYEGRVRKGGILLSLHCDSDEWAKKGKAVLEHTGAEDISSASEAKADFAVSDKPLARTVAGDREAVPVAAATYPNSDVVVDPARETPAEVRREAAVEDRVRREYPREEPLRQPLSNEYPAETRRDAVKEEVAKADRAVDDALAARSLSGAPVVRSATAGYPPAEDPLADPVIDAYPTETRREIAEDEAARRSVVETDTLPPRDRR